VSFHTSIARALLQHLGAGAAAASPMSEPCIFALVVEALLPDFSLSRSVASLLAG